MATETKQFTGWISIDGGLVNLAHVELIDLVVVEEAYVVRAHLLTGDDITLTATEDRPAAEKALRYLAANVKAIYPVRS
jgi:hypothetical protein